MNCGCQYSIDQGIKHLWSAFTERPAACLLGAIAEHEIAERGQRRIERHRAEAGLPPDKTLSGFNFDAVPTISKGRVMALGSGDSWLETSANLILVGGPGGGKAHLATAIGLGLIENGPIAKIGHVLLTPTTDLVLKRQLARRELAFGAAIACIDKYQLIILDDLAYVTRDQPATSVLFGLISARYERRSITITANQPFGDWNRIFPDSAITLAATGRLMHHSNILELNVERYRRGEAICQRRGSGRLATRATLKAAILNPLRHTTVILIGAQF